MSRKKRSPQREAPVEKLVLSYEVSEEDIRRFHDYHLWHHTRRAPAALFVIAIAGTASALMFANEAPPLSTALYSGVFPVLAFVWVFWYSKRKMVRIARETGTLGPQTLEFTKRGLSQRRANGAESRRPWEQPVRIVERNEQVFVYLNPVQALIVPRRAFATPEDLEQFRTALEGWSSGA